MQNILITGTGRPQALGFNLVRRYLEHGDRVFACVRKSTDTFTELLHEYPGELTVLVMDISDTRSVRAANFMQAVNRGRESFLLAAIRQIGLNIPILFLMNALFGMMGIVWTQAVADIVNVVISYIIYARVIREIRGQKA